MESITTTQHWLTGNDWADLAAINQSTFNIAILQRQPITEIVPCANALVGHSWQAINGSGTLADLENDVSIQLSMLGNALQISMQALVDDLAGLAHQFAKISPCQTYRWRFAKVKSNMCTRYHADINDLRLLCTYYGPGTLWLTQDNINARALRRNLYDELVKEHSQVRQILPFEVALLKGALHTENNPGAVLHRSPTIEEHGTIRLLFRMDTDSFGSIT